jgi:hypothetical protein
VARKSTLGESTILRKSFGGCELASIFRVAFSFLNSMYYMLFAVGLENEVNPLSFRLSRRIVIGTMNRKALPSLFV